MDNKVKRSIGALCAVVVLLIASCVVIWVKFEVTNSFVSASGLLRILFTEEEYVTIQHSPKVMLSQPDPALLVQYMESRGYTEDPERQLGAMRVFTNGDHAEHILYSQNQYFSKWSWQE